LPKLAAALHTREVAVDSASGVDNREQAAYMTIEPLFKKQMGIPVTRNRE